MTRRVGQPAPLNVWIWGSRVKRLTCWREMALAKSTDNPPPTCPHRIGAGPAGKRRIPRAREFPQRMRAIYARMVRGQRHEDNPCWLAQQLFRQA